MYALKNVGIAHSDRWPDHPASYQFMVHFQFLKNSFLIEHPELSGCDDPNGISPRSSLLGKSGCGFPAFCIQLSSRAIPLVSIT